jgi:hypothetical protein
MAAGARLTSSCLPFLCSARLVPLSGKSAKVKAQRGEDETTGSRDNTDRVTQTKRAEGGTFHPQLFALGSLPFARYGRPIVTFLCKAIAS